MKTLETSLENQKIKSRSNGFQLHIWDNTQNKESLRPVKEFSKQIYKDAGYSEYETVDLDNWSKWFFVTFDGHLQAATRVVEKHKKT